MSLLARICDRLGFSRNVTLQHTGQMPMIITGTLEFDGKATTTDDKRHLRLSVYRLRNHGCTYAYHVSYTSEWKQEVEHHHSGYADSFVDLGKRLSAIHATDWVSGYPNVERFRQKQADLMVEVTARWADLVNKALVRLMQ